MGGSTRQDRERHSRFGQPAKIVWVVKRPAAGATGAQPGEMDNRGSEKGTTLDCILCSGQLGRRGISSGHFGGVK